MAEPKPHIVARWISEEIGNVEFLRLHDVVEQVLSQHLVGWSREAVAELSEELVPEVFVHLGRIRDHNVDQGIEPTYELSEELGAAYIKGLPSRAPELLAQLRNIEPKRFERFCARVLIEMGAEGSDVGGTKDGGVDFIAFNLPVARHAGAAFRGSYPIVLGQSKRYGQNRLVSVSDLRSFVGAAVVREDQLKRVDERFGIYTPVVYAFWTTSDFTGEGRAYAKRAGLWCLGSLALAQVTLRLGIDIEQI